MFVKIISEHQKITVILTEKKPQFTDFYIYYNMHKKRKTKYEIYENINNRW